MKIIRSRQALQKWRKSLSSESLGFVPTMGYLHEGHLDLVRRAQDENDRVVVSIFVNPTQFGPREDLAAYPRDEKRDLRLLRAEGCDVVFLPRSKDELYPKGSDVLVLGRHQSKKVLEGAFRPQHFDGVTTVVLKLFHLVQPDRAYFGEKDYQQLQIIKQMVADLFLPIRIFGVRTRREESGLAMSSRNSYLSDSDRRAAAQFYQVLRDSKTIPEAKRLLKKAGFKIDYVESWTSDLSRPGKGRWLAAVHFKGVRLIDNLKKN